MVYPRIKPWKNLTTAEGGASTWLPLEGIDNAEIYKMMQLLSLHGQNKDALAKTKIGAWEYDIIGPWLALVRIGVALSAFGVLISVLSNLKKSWNEYQERIKP